MRIVIWLLFLLAGSHVNAAVYKWVDEKGQVHYSNKPRGNEAKEVKIRDQRINTTPGATPETAQQRLDRQRKFLEASQQEKEVLQQEKAKQREEEQKRERNCHLARDNLDGMQNAGVLYDLDENGNRVIFNDEQKKKALQHARQMVEKWCD